MELLFRRAWARATHVTTNRCGRCSGGSARYSLRARSPSCSRRPRVRQPRPRHWRRRCSFQTPPTSCGTCSWAAHARRPRPGLLFADSLVATAPQLALLSDPWQGAFRAADHGALFPGAADIEQVVLFPLRARGALVACLNVGTTGRARVPGDGDPWVLAHVGEVMSAALERQLDAMRLRRGAFTNPLTGWHTRRFLEARLKEAIARCERHGGDVTCVLIDIDGLKAVNDAYGQLAGDQALREIAARIEAQLRASDAAAHFDADQFVVLLPDARVDSAVPLAERILDAVRSEPIQAASGLLLPMSVSIGLASVAAGLESGNKSLSNHLLAKAESALHLAKSRGGNSYTLADA